MDADSRSIIPLGRQQNEFIKRFVSFMCKR